MRLIKEANLSGAEKKVALAVLFLLAFSSYYYFFAASSTDKSWLLFAAKKWLMGGRLYTDILEINPPLIIWLYSIPVLLSGVLPEVTAYHALALMMFAILALVFYLSVQLIGLHPAFKEEPKRQIFFLLLLAVVLIFCVAPMYFSDREHLFLVLTLPYVLRFCPGIATQKLPANLTWATGVLAAVGFCIKPHTAVVFVTLQLLFIVREKSPAILTSTENILIYGLGGSYVLSILMFTPEYVHIVLPMAMETYSAYSRKANGAYSVIIFIIITAITFADFRRCHRTPYRQGVWYFLGVCGGYLLYGLINNGWAYTYIPLLSMARILAGWVFLEFLWLKKQAEARGESPRQFVFGARSCGVNLGLNVLFYVICFVSYLEPSDCSKMTYCLGNTVFFREAEARPVHSFGTMSLEFYKWPVLAQSMHARWDTRFNHIWMLPKFILSGPAFKEKNAWIIDYVGKAYAEDLNSHKPEVVYVDSSPELFHGRPNIDLPGYFSVIPEFREAWSHYKRSDVIEACVKAPRGQPAESSLKIDCRFDIYRRMPVP